MAFVEMDFASGGSGAEKVYIKEYPFSNQSITQAVNKQIGTFSESGTVLGAICKLTSATASSAVFPVMSGNAIILNTLATTTNTVSGSVYVFYK